MVVVPTSNTTLAGARCRFRSLHKAERHAERPPTRRYALRFGGMPDFRVGVPDIRDRRPGAEVHVAPMTLSPTGQCCVMVAPPAGHVLAPIVVPARPSGQMTVDPGMYTFGRPCPLANQDWPLDDGPREERHITPYFDSTLQVRRRIYISANDCDQRYDAYLG